MRTLCEGLSSLSIPIKNASGILDHALVLYSLCTKRNVKLQGKYREGKRTNIQTGSWPRHLYQQPHWSVSNYEAVSERGILQWLRYRIYRLIYAIYVPYITWLWCYSLGASQRSSFLSVETTAFTQLFNLHSKTVQPFLRDMEDTSVCQRHAGHSFCRSECPVQPWVGKTCPTGNCSKSCG